MPERSVVARELAEVFKQLAHPDRVRLVEELGGGERSVGALASALDLPGPRVSQHLASLRAYRLVAERREGRRHYYSLVQPELAAWIVQALTFVEGRVALDPETVRAARAAWSHDRTDP